MKLSKQQLSDIIYTPVVRDELDRLASDARAELEEGTLEIEGYERSAWIKFDLDDESTHPTKIDEYLASFSFGVVKITAWDGKNLGFASSDSRYITHWRPLPEKPQGK